MPIFTAGGLARTRPLVAGGSGTTEEEGGASRLRAKRWSSSRRQSACSSKETGRAATTPGSTVSGASWAKMAVGVASLHPVAAVDGWRGFSECSGGLELALLLLAPAGLCMTAGDVLPYIMPTVGVGGLRCVAGFFL